MNHQMQPNAEKRGGKFCSRCGQPLDASGICLNPSCPSRLAAWQQASQTASAQPAVPGILTHSFDYVKVFFSSRPFAALDNIARSQENVWPVLGGTSVLLTVLGLFGIGYQDIQGANVATSFSLLYHIMRRNATDDIQTPLARSMEWLTDNFKLFSFFLLTVLLQFFVSAGINCLTASVNKQKLSYSRSLNLLSVVLMPLAVSSAAAFLLSYISAFAGGICLLIGVILSSIQLYYGMQRVCRFEKSPFWTFSAAILAHAASIYGIVTLVGAILD